jgi:hypothetical protein
MKWRKDGAQGMPAPYLEESAMIQNSQPADQAIHTEAIKAARECVWCIPATLREGEVIETTRQFYGIIRERMESLQANGGRAM